MKAVSGELEKHVVIRSEGVSHALVATAVAEHRARLKAGTDRVIKSTGRTSVTRVQVNPDGRQWIVKEYHWAGIRQFLKGFMRPAPEVREWRAMRRLADEGIPAVRGVALARRRKLSWGQSSFVISEELKDATMCHEYIRERLSSRDAGARRDFVVSGAQCLAGLHARGIYHHDLKAPNVMVQERNGGWVFNLIDLASVSFCSHISRRRIIKNLAQLNASLPAELGARERFRFLESFCSQVAGLPGVSGTARKALAHAMRFDRTW